ncbi:LPXTG cell wall anchor domain-containing protein [Streptococcus sp. HF-100]|uniref:LPXTG cell wall anchor domain-containing protein n=1 Tax=Streptococcus sp. HF-100 TaxID=2785791 RepID=UPI00189FB779|nr:LPXTG cell wall anchor domain-containing protein [Streptococcus sp. HF-100]MBF7076399.1 LPXTG cell wall anchor domain-containing protein [Streptococcus sp. HF-100]
MKKVAKYGITLLSVAVLGAVTPPAVAAEDTTAPRVDAPAAETAAPAVSKVRVGIFYGVTSPNPVKEWNIELKEGESYTAEAPSIAGYKFVMGAHYDGGQVREFHTKTYTIKYMSFQGMPEDQSLAFYYELDPEQPAPNPEQPADPQKPGLTPTPTPEPTPQPTPNPSDNGNNSNQGNKLNPSDSKPKDNGNGKSENPTDNQNPAKNGNDSTPSDNGEKQNSSNQGDNNRDTTKQSEINKSNETTKNKLPNTGEAVSSLGFLGVGLLSSLGLTKKLYKGRHERH